MYINPATTVIVAFEYNHPVDMAMRDWLGKRFPQSHVFSIKSQPYIPARNNAYWRVLNHPQNNWEWVLSVDNDVSPVDTLTDDWLLTPGDIVSCRCNMPSRENCYGQPDSFHNPLWFGNLTKLRELPLPWFLFDYGPEGREVVACDCECLRKKAKAAGLTIRHGGFCNHLGQSSTHVYGGYAPPM